MFNNSIFSTYKILCYDNHLQSMKTVMSQCKKRLIEAVQYQYFRNCSSLNILQHKRYIRTTNLYVYCVLANSKGVRTKSILGWTQTSSSVLMLHKGKIYFVFVQMYQNVKNTWGYLISMTYRRRNCEKSSSFKWSWLSWICFHTTCSLSVERKEEPVAKVGSHAAGEGCLGGGLLSASPRMPIWPFGSVAMLYPSDKATTESLLPESMAPGECLKIMTACRGEGEVRPEKFDPLGTHLGWWGWRECVPFKDWKPLPYHQKGYG